MRGLQRRLRLGLLLKSPGLGLVLVSLLVLGGWLVRPAARVQSAEPLQSSLPLEGWRVCADLGFGPVPGVSGNVQRILLCTAEDWQVRAYCLEPQKPAPALDTICSRTNATDFWCGDGVQRLGLYQIQQTPTFTPTPTITDTPVPPTATVTPTATLLPSLTPTGTLPPTLSPTPVTETPQAPPDEATSPTPTVFDRPYPGGPGNLTVVLSLLFATTGLGLLAAAWFTTRRR